MEILKLAGSVAVFVIVIWVQVDADRELECDGSDFECEGPYNFITCVYLQNGQKLYVPNRCQLGTVCNPRNSPAEPCDLETAPGTTVSTAPTSTADRATTLKEPSTLSYVRPTIPPKNSSDPSDQKNLTNLDVLNEADRNGFLHFKFGFNLTSFNTLSNETFGSVTKVSQKQPFAIQASANVALNSSTRGDVTSFASVNPHSSLPKSAVPINDLKTETNSPQFSVNTITQGFLRFSETQLKRFYTFTNFEISNSVSGITINMTTDIVGSEVKSGDMTISGYGTLSLSNFLKRSSNESTTDNKLSVNMPKEVLKMSDDNKTIIETTFSTVGLEEDIFTENETEAVTHRKAEATQSFSSDQLIPFVTSVVTNIEMTTKDSNRITDSPALSTSMFNTNNSSNPNSVAFDGFTEDGKSDGKFVTVPEHTLGMDSNLTQQNSLETSADANYTKTLSNNFMPSTLNNEITTSMPNTQSTTADQPTDIKASIASSTEALPNPFVVNQSSSETLGTQIEASLKVLPEISLIDRNPGIAIQENEDNDPKSFQKVQKLNEAQNSSITSTLYTDWNTPSAEMAPRVFVGQGETSYPINIQPLFTADNNGSIVKETQNSITVLTEATYLNNSLMSTTGHNSSIFESNLAYETGAVTNDSEPTTMNSTNDTKIIAELQNMIKSLDESSTRNSTKTFFLDNLYEVTNNVGIENVTSASLNITQTSGTTTKSSLVDEFKPTKATTSAELITPTEVNIVNLTSYDFIQPDQSVNHSSPLPTEILDLNTTGVLVPQETSSTTYAPFDIWDSTSPSTQIPKPTQQSAEILNAQNVMSLEVTNNEFISAEIISKPTTQTPFPTSMETVTDSTTKFTTPLEMETWTQSSTSMDRGVRALGYNSPVEDMEQATEPYIEKTTFTANNPIRYNLTNAAQDEVDNFNVGLQIEKDVNVTNPRNGTSLFTLEVIADLGEPQSGHKSIVMQEVKHNKTNEAAMKLSDGLAISSNWPILNQMIPHPVVLGTTFHESNHVITLHRQNSSSSSIVPEETNSNTEPQKRELQHAGPVLMLDEAPMNQIRNTISSNWAPSGNIYVVESITNTENTPQREESTIFASELENATISLAEKLDLPYVSEPLTSEIVNGTNPEKNITSLSSNAKDKTMKESSNSSIVQISFRSTPLLVRSTNEPGLLVNAENKFNDNSRAKYQPTEILLQPQASLTYSINEGVKSTNDKNVLKTSPNLLNTLLSVSNEQIALATTENSIQVSQPILVCQRHGVYPDINNCQQYYLCVKQQSGFVKILGTCPPRTAFSYAAQRCVKDVSRCHKEKCRTKGNYTDPFDNTSYFACVEIEPGVFVKYHLQCVAPLTFLSTEGRCDLISSTTDQILPSVPTGLAEIEQTTMSNPRSYSTHSLIEPEYREMPAITNKYETAFIESFPVKGPETTLQVSNTESVGRAVRSTNSFECSQDGVFPSRENCKDFYMCVRKADGSFTQILRQCPAHYAFHSRSKSCSRDMSVCSELWCYGTGNFPDPKDETSYYRCVPNARGGFRIYHIKCAEAKIYVPSKNLCFENMTSATTSLPALVAEKENISVDTNEMLQDESVPTPTTEASYEILNQTLNLTSEYPVVSEAYRVEAEEKLRGILQDMRDEAVQQHEAEMLLKKPSKRHSDSESESDENLPETEKYCQEEGRFRDRSNCRKYFICSKRRTNAMKLYHLNCRGSDIFDAEKRICVNEEDARCLDVMIRE